LEKENIYSELKTKYSKIRFWNAVFQKMTDFAQFLGRIGQSEDADWRRGTRMHHEAQSQTVQIP